jgi:hypothetical protein
MILGVSQGVTMMVLPAGPAIELFGFAQDVGEFAVRFDG